MGYCNIRQTVQRENESIDDFHIRLRRLESPWKKMDKSKEVRFQLLAGCRSAELRRSALQHPGITIDEVILMGRALELVEVEKQRTAGSQRRSGGGHGNETR